DRGACGMRLWGGGEEGIGGGEVGQGDLGGFSVEGTGGDDLEVLVAVDDLGGERRHVLVNTTAGRSMSRGSVRFLLSHYGYGRGYYSKAGARRSPLNLVTTHFDLSRNANRLRSDRKRSAKNTVNASFSEEPEGREGCDASGRTDIHPANPESQASARLAQSNQAADRFNEFCRIVTHADLKHYLYFFDVFDVT